MSTATPNSSSAPDPTPESGSNARSASTLTRTQIQEQNRYWTEHVNAANDQIVDLGTSQEDLGRFIDRSSTPARTVPATPDANTDIRSIENLTQNLEVLSDEHRSGNDTSDAWWNGGGRVRYVEIRNQMNSALVQARDAHDFWRTADVGDVNIRAELDRVLRLVNARIKPNGDFGNPATATENHQIIRELINDISKLLGNMRTAARPKNQAPASEITDPTVLGEFGRQRDTVCFQLDVISREELWSRREFNRGSTSIAAFARQLDEEFARLRGQSIDLAELRTLNARLRRFLNTAIDTSRNFNNIDRRGVATPRSRPSDFVFEFEQISDPRPIRDITMDRRTALRALLGVAAVPVTYYAGKGLLGSLFRKKSAPEEEVVDPQNTNQQASNTSNAAPSTPNATSQLSTSTPEQNFSISGFSVHREDTKLVYTVPSGVHIGKDTKIFVGKLGMKNQQVSPQVVGDKLVMDIPAPFLQGGGNVRTLVQHWNGTRWEMSSVLDIAL